MPDAPSREPSSEHSGIPAGGYSIGADGTRSFEQLANELEIFPYGAPLDEMRAAREAAVKRLWDKREMLPENSEEIVEDVLAAALPFFRFYPLGDNHHRADACPYCSPRSSS